MRRISQRVKKILLKDQNMKVCIYNDSDCENENGTRPARAEWEHAFTYAGRQIDEWWAIIGVCWYHHRGLGLNKDYNRYRALARTNENDMAEMAKKYPRVDWAAFKEWLTDKFTPKI